MYSDTNYHGMFAAEGPLKNVQSYGTVLNVIRTLIMVRRAYI